MCVSVPGLIVTTQDLSSASDNITVLVVVEDECAGGDELNIIATVNDFTGEVMSQQANFTNTTFIFGLLPPAQYTCTISIVMGSQTLDAMSMLCGSGRGTYNYYVAVVTFGITCTTFDRNYSSPSECASYCWWCCWRLCSYNHCGCYCDRDFCFQEKER